MKERLQLKAENYDEAAANGFFVKNPDGKPYVGRWWKGMGSMIDFTNPLAKRWWQDQVRQAIQAGADGFKDDDAEGNFLGPVKFADGTDMRVMRNRYAVLYNNAMEELIQKDLKGNGVLFARSVDGRARMGLECLWGGDNEASFSTENGLPTVVTAGLGAGLSGMPLWTADLGGYEKTPSTPDPMLFQAVDGVCGVFSGDGGDVGGERRAVGLWRCSAGDIHEIRGAAYEPVSLPLCGRAGGREDGDADHARSGADESE